ncbi:PP2C-domain-containing protein [Gloeophyllum trabeum ATCC 11539]|uniref:protein-serine/threonine phosphatase n=1 Tax=Gloeophyllum trabeum (strain ATCC 11539 / FP-39264 / Madison 617) TaxID=670483 RepID=S7Q3F7_GLOTA|nr:PP2C-domain-containing protein [Gloeophyllum trabeum ATCC 11539]EPQ54511.1 PP2C-domain-containing protein [Gloeophyllum trabeum ATCC 11539]
MGQTLSVPATDKNTESGGNDRFMYAVSEMQGWRITMEDAHTIALRLDEDKDEPNAFFAVYDGHGGSNVARYAGRNVHKRLASQEEYQAKRYPEALKRAFLGTDEDMLADPSYTREPSGSTALAALVTADNKIYAANAGDSRGVISVKGEAKQLSYDHKPANQTEKDRITAAGGYIEYGRVNGNLALARALGDFDFKKNYKLSPEKQIITSDPEIIEHQITEEDEFIVLACDGIWDCLSSQDVVDIVRLKVAEGKELPEIVEFLCDHCLAPNTTEGTGVGCDNMTVLIVAILHGRTKEQWYEWIKDRVENKYGYDTPREVKAIYSQPYRPREGAGRAGPMASRLMANGLGGAISLTPIFHGGNEGLMFETDSEEEDGNSDDESQNSSFFSQSFGPGIGNLRQQLMMPQGDEDYDLEANGAGSKVNGDAEAEESRVEDADMDSSNDDKDATPQQERQGEAPPPPKPLPNGDAVSRTPDQFETHPAGDEPSAVVKTEGLMDTSESPLKG